MSSTVFDYCLKIFLILSTLFYMVPPGQIDPMAWSYLVQEDFFKFGVIFLYGFSMFFKSFRSFECKSMATFFTYLMVITVVGIFGDFEKYYIMNIFLGLVFYKLVYERIRLWELKKYAAWLFWLMVANFILCVFQWFDIDPIFTHIHHNIVPVAELVVGFMKLQAALGIIACMVAPILFLLHPLTVLICVPLLFWSKSSASVMAFVISMGFMTYFRLPRKIWIGLVGLILVLGALYVVKADMPSGDFGERFKIWGKTLNISLTRRPMTGMGLESFSRSDIESTQVTQKDNLIWLWAHNEYLQVLFELGIAGLVMVICFIRGRFRDFGENFKNRDLQALFGCLLSILMVSFFHFPFHMGKMIGLTLFLMAAFHAKADDLKYEKI